MTGQPDKPSRVILITGASSGIGRAAALAFARRGDRVAVTARRMDRLTALVEEAKPLPGAIQPYEADVCDADSMNRVAADLFARWGRLDVVIPNAGLGQRGSIVESAWEDLDSVLRTNIDGVLFTVRAAVPYLRQSGGGQIITISSVASLAITPYAATYAASKAALNALARALRVELEPDHIWVTNVLVGQTATEFASTRKGESGKVASNLPTMTADYVANCLVRETTRRRRTVTLRWLDRLINVAGVFLPWLMDRILLRIYKPH